MWVDLNYDLKGYFFIVKEMLSLLQDSLGVWLDCVWDGGGERGLQITPLTQTPGKGSQCDFMVPSSS